MRKKAIISFAPALCLGDCPSVEESREKPFPAPAETKFMAGEGATEEDLRRGYLDPNIQEKPEYDMRNYKERWSEPERGDMDPDWDFRRRNRETEGLFVRNPYAIER